MITIHGIPNCDSVKTARKWFADRGLDVRFHDLRKDGLDAAMVERWRAALGETLLNRRGPSWRKLTDADKAKAEAGEAAVLIANPTVIKRPVVDIDGGLVVGVDEPAWERALKAGR